MTKIFLTPDQIREILKFIDLHILDYVESKDRILELTSLKFTIFKQLSDAERDEVTAKMMTDLKEVAEKIENKTL